MTGLGVCLGVARPLHEMVGLPADASTDELRRAYEAAMSDATRTGEHQRAVNLSRAFDQLSASQRHQVYARHDLARTRTTMTAPQFTRERRARSERPRAERPRRNRRRRIERILGFCLPPAIVLASVLVFVHSRESGSPTRSGPVAPSVSISTGPAPVLPVPPTPTAPPTPTGSAGPVAN